MKDMNGKIIKKGDPIKINELKTKVEGFSIVVNQEMVDTEFGSFSPDIIEVINDN